MPTRSTSAPPAHPQVCVTFTRVVGLLALLACTAISAAAQPCQGPGAPATTQTKCLTAIAIPGNPLRSFDISWVDLERGLYFFADRSNSGVDIISTATNTFIGRAGGFVGIVLAGMAVNNNLSGPDGVVSRGNCLYAGDGDSTLKVFDITDPTSPVFATSIGTGGSTRVDEMALTADGKFLLAANNAEDPPFATLFAVNGDNGCGSISIVGPQIKADPSAIPSGFGLSIEQPAWDQATQRFIVSVPTIANNPNDPAGCNYGQLLGPVTCSGAVLVIDPTNLFSR